MPREASADASTRFGVWGLNTWFFTSWVNFGFWTCIGSSISSSCSMGCAFGFGIAFGFLGMSSNLPLQVSSCLYL